MPVRVQRTATVRADVAQQGSHTTALPHALRIRIWMCCVSSGSAATNRRGMASR